MDEPHSKAAIIDAAKRIRAAGLTYGSVVTVDTLCGFLGIRNPELLNDRDAHANAKLVWLRTFTALNRHLQEDHQLWLWRKASNPAGPFRFVTPSDWNRVSAAEELSALQRAIRNRGREIRCAPVALMTFAERQEIQIATHRLNETRNWLRRRERQEQEEAAA